MWHPPASVSRAARTVDRDRAAPTAWPANPWNYHSTHVMVDRSLPTASGILATVLCLSGISREAACARTGCRPDLMDGILDGSIDPCIDTLERIANWLEMEIRINDDGAKGMFPAGAPDEAAMAEYRCLRDKETTEGWIRFGRGDIARGAAAQGFNASDIWPEWDGTDPAPGRRLSADFTRSDRGGMSAMLVRIVASESRRPAADLLAAAGIPAGRVREIDEGTYRPPFQAIARIVELKQAGMRFMIGPYDSNDDFAQLHFLNNVPEYTRVHRLRQSGKSPVAGICDRDGNLISI